MMHSILPTRRRGHTLMELVVATISSAVLLAGLGSVMLIGRQVAYTPSAAARRIEAADIVNQITDELQTATLLVGQTPGVLEFVVADRDDDGAAERIRYEWSGTVGDPLRKTTNGGTPIVVLDAVKDFDVSYILKSENFVFDTITESGEAVLAENDDVASGLDQNITATSHFAQQVDPLVFAGRPANALSWNATKVEFYGSANETLVIQLRPTGEPYDQPVGGALGQVSVTIADYNWQTLSFPNPIRNLELHRQYAIVWSGIGSGSAALLLYNDNAPSGVLESTDAGASWQYMPSRQTFWRIFGTYNTPGPSYNATRSFVTHVQLRLQTAEQSHARVDASVPLVNMPEHLSAYWRTDFDRDPTATDMNGDAVADWALAGGASFDGASLINGVWYANGALETRPPNDFTRMAIVEVCCRNSTVGGNGAVVRVNADRQLGVYAPLIVQVQRQNDDTQTLTLYGRTSDALRKFLFSRSRLSTDFVRFRLTIVPEYDLVNLTINDEDQGSFIYPTYAPSSTTDRFLTLYSDTSLSEFDYVDVRVAN